MFTVEVVAGQGLIPVVVKVRIAVPENVEGGVHVVLRELAFGENVPPAEVVHVPPLADPPTVPAKTDDPPWQMV
jgi:hypothetical protein